MICALVGLATAGVSRVASSGDDVHAEVSLLKSDVRADGFESALETTNNIQESRSGDVQGNIHGDFAWISPEGEHIQVSYVANENGYQPSSNILPTPPPVPEAILRAIQYIAAHPSPDAKNY